MKKLSFLVRLAFLVVCGLPVVGGNVLAGGPTVRYERNALGDDDDGIEFLSSSAPPQDYEDSAAQGKKSQKAAAKKEKDARKAAENAHKKAVKEHKETWDAIAHVTRGGNLKYTIAEQEKLQEIYVDTLSNLVLGKSEQAIKTKTEKELYKIYRDSGRYAAAREAFRGRIENAHSRFARSTYFFSGNPKPYSSRDFAVTSSRFITSREKMESGIAEKIHPSVRRLLELNVESGVAIDERGKKTIITPLQIRIFDKTCEELTKLSKKKIKGKRINLEKIISFTKTLSEDAKYRVQARMIVGHKDKQEEERVQALLRLNNSPQPPKVKEVNRRQG